MQGWSRATAIVLLCWAQTSAWAGEVRQDWSGIYVGVNAGYATAEPVVTFEDFTLPGLGHGYSATSDGYLVGGQIGLRHQLGSWLVGIEAAGNGGDLSATARGSGTSGLICETCTFAQESERFTTNLDDLFTLAGRIGYIRDDWLLYAKAGYASADVDLSGAVDGIVDACDGPCTLSGRAQSEARHDGWLFGAGFERRIGSNLTWGLDYARIDLRSARHIGASHSQVGDSSFDGVVHFDVNPEALHSVTARLNFELISWDR